MHVDWIPTLASVAGLLLGGSAFIKVSFMPNSKRSPVVSPMGLAPHHKIKDVKLLKLIYVLSDMQGRSIQEARDRKEYVQQQFVHLLRMGVYPVSVGVNTEFSMRDYAVPAVFEEGSKELAARCDAILVMPGFDRDPEAVNVLAYAESKGLKVFASSEGHIQEKLKAWAVDE